MTKLSDFASSDLRLGEIQVQEQSGYKLDEDHSKLYKSAIAHLVEKLAESNEASSSRNNSGILKDIDLAELVKSGWLWDDLVAIKPEVQNLAYEVEEAINYELSFNQCCNAVNWVHRYSREQGKHLL